MGNRVEQTETNGFSVGLSALWGRERFYTQRGVDLQPTCTGLTAYGAFSPFCSFRADFLSGFQPFWGSVVLYGAASSIKAARQTPLLPLVTVSYRCRHLSDCPRMRRLRHLPPRCVCMHRTNAVALHPASFHYAVASRLLRTHPYPSVQNGGLSPRNKKSDGVFPSLFELIFANDGIFSVTFAPDFYQ